ncbi:MAG TPA: SLBB domain-containing protein, partial [Nitrospiria bacterium]|nr:SLBB domain-containing protein [Nitrospiria bacterium]
MESVPVGPDYLLGPGDEIKVVIWGKVNAEHSTIIDRDGKIVLPHIGVLQLAGLTFAEAKAYLEKELSRYYKASEVKMNVSMGRLRSMTVFVVGKAQRPGSYTLSSLSTLINALFAAGGPSKNGTMRDIQVKRKGETLVHFDLYDFLLKGDKTKDVRLMPEDVIFIPPVGPLVGIAGDVKNPAIYELKEETKLLDLVWMAGGLTSVAFKGRVQVQRIVNNQFRTIFESDMVGMDQSSEKNFLLKDGDLLKIFPVVEERTTVVVSGAVANPGEYGVKSGQTRISDVLAKAGGLLYYASNEAELTRVKVTQQGPQTERYKVNVAKAMAGDADQNMPLEMNDYLFIRAVPEWQLYMIVRVEGEVKFPGAYTIKKGETLSSLIERSGGFTDKAYLEGATFTRESVKVLQQTQLNEAIDRLQQEILAKSAATSQTSLSRDEALQMQVSMQQQSLLLEKMRAAKAKGRITIHLNVPEKLKGTPSDLTLENGDSLVIPQRPQHVQVLGSVYNQTAFIYNPKETVSDYLKKAGGMTDDAEEDNLYVLKVDGAAISQREEGGFFSRGLLSKKLDAGDTIVVPEKIERVAWVREIK